MSHCKEDKLFPSWENLDTLGNEIVSPKENHVYEKYKRVLGSHSPDRQVICAAETLLEMANDGSCWSKFVKHGSSKVLDFDEKWDDFKYPFAWRERKQFYQIKDHWGLSSNGLGTFCGTKHKRDYRPRRRVHCQFSDDVRNQRRKIGYDCGNNDEDREVSGSMLVPKLRKQEPPVITPTIHKRFSFSVIHLLLAIRLALIAPSHDNTLLHKKFLTDDDEREHILSFNKGLNTKDMDIMCRSYYSMDEIIEQVRSKPGDPHILRTKERLVDLVRGAMRILSSKTLPLDAKGWKQLVAYDKCCKGWSWIGPVPCFPLEQDEVFGACTPEAWGLKRNMLVKLVDSFAEWLHTNQRALQQLGTLAPPLLALTLCKINPKERFGALKGTSCSPTIKPCLNEVRAYFRCEERIRYMIPDRAFAYTLVDGRKSSVAPLKKCGEKLSLRARDHSLLKPDRPGCITVLTVVRDAAARLPGGIGTRGDVAVLFRDSQYIVEGISDEQMGAVVSGGLDRLHYERDPCVMFDRQKRLWVYLHGERQEEDFDDDGRQSRIVRGANHNDYEGI